MPLGWTWEIQGATSMLAQSQGLIKPQIPSDSTKGLSPVRPAEGREAWDRLPLSPPFKPLSAAALLVSASHLVKVTERRTEDQGLPTRFRRAQGQVPASGPLPPLQGEEAR